MRSWLSAVKWSTANLLIHWRNGRADLDGSGDPSRTILFDVRNNLYERYLLLLVLFFDREGYRVILKARRSFIRTWNTNLILRFVPRARLGFGRDPGALLRITDDGEGTGDDDMRTLRLDHDYFAPPEPGIFRVPMPMVNTVYVKDLELGPVVPSGNPLERMRQIKLFFSGDFRPEAYASADVMKVFGVMGRRAMYEAIRQHFQDLLYRARRWEDLAHVDRPLVIIDRYNDFNVPPPELRWVLDHTDFTIAFPGVVMPWTHGVIEAMSEGVVPIIQYPHLFSPLRDGVDCIAFADEKGLVEAIKRALALDAGTIAGMKEHVRRYYQAHLSSTAVVNGIVNGHGLKGIRLMAEHRSVARLKERLAGDPTVVAH